MASPELAVLAGVKSCIEEQKKNRNVSKVVELHNLLDAVNDIFDGLLRGNRDSDREYFRMKVTSWLVAKTLEKYCSPVVFSDKFMNELRHVPSLDLDDLFLVIYKANLLTPFLKLLAELNGGVQCFMASHLKSWISARISSLQNEKSSILLTFEDIIAFSTSMIVTGTVISILSCKNITNIVSTVKDLIILVKQSSFHGRSTVPSPHCMITLINLESDLLKTMDSIDSTGTPSFDVLKLGEFSQLVSDSTQTSKNREQFGKTNLLEKFKDIEANCSAYYELTLSENDFEAMEDCRIMLQHVVEQFSENADVSTVKSEEVSVKEMFQRIHDLFETLVSKMCGSYSGHQIERKDLDEYLEIIRYFKAGYKVAANELLSMIIKNPLSHSKWENAFDCLMNSPECLADSETLLQILDGLKCIIDGMEDFKENLCALTEVACKIQNLFWHTYALLPRKSKLVICKEVMSNPEYVGLISEYPFQNQNKDAQDHSEFYLKKEKKLNLYFSQLINKTMVTENTIEDICTVMLCSPGETIKKLVEQIFVNPKQTDFYVDLLRRIPYVGEYSIKGDGRTQFLKCFHEISLEYWRKSEYKFVENGINFIHNLLKEVNAMDNDSSVIQNFTQDLCLNTLMPSFNSSRIEPDTFPELLSLRVLSCVISTKIFTSCIALHQTALLCICLGAYVDKSHNFWISNPNFDVGGHELAIECLEFLVTSLSEQLVNDDADDSKTVLKWTMKSISKFRWTTQIRFINVIKIGENPKIKVPGCLSEVCRIPDVFECSGALSYGPGTGLIPWHQCFVIDPSLCPLSSLDIAKLTGEETDLFTNGWIVTLSQVLPYCLPHEWITLTEASKLLLSNFKLSIALDTAHINIMPVVDMNQCHIILGLVQMMHKVLSLLSSRACINWTYHSLWLHVTKCYCMIMSRSVNDSSEFVKASSDSQLFMLVQIFCKSCDLILLLYQSIPQEESSMKYSENIFILLFDILTTFESIFQVAMETANKPANQDFESDSKEEPGVELDSDDSASCEAYTSTNRIKLKQEVLEHINIMQKSVLMLPTDHNSGALISKLKQIL